VLALCFGTGCRSPEYLILLLGGVQAVSEGAPAPKHQKEEDEADTQICCGSIALHREPSPVKLAAAAVAAYTLSPIDLTLVLGYLG
jgi:hypothetical protein